MDHMGIFSATLGLSQLWQIDRVSFVEGIRRVDLFLSCRSASRFTCPACGGEAELCATREELWYHVDFLRYTAFLHADVPQVECRTGCGIGTITVPWSRSGSRFILVGYRPGQTGAL